MIELAEGHCGGFTRCGIYDKHLTHKLQCSFEQDVIVMLFGQLMVGPWYQSKRFLLRRRLVMPCLGSWVRNDDIFLAQNHNVRVGHLCRIKHVNGAEATCIEAERS